MKVALRGLLVVAVALAVGVAALEWLRDRLEQSETLRQSLEGAALAQLELPLRAGPIEVVFFPAQLRLPEPVLELPGEARLKLGEARIDLDLASLLEGNARLRALRVSGPARLVHAQLDLSGALRLELNPGEAPGDWSVDASGRLDSGGVFALRGVVRPGDGFSGEVDLEELDSKPFASLLTSEDGEPPRLVGIWEGRLDFSASGDPVTLRLASPHAEMKIPPVTLVGPVSLVAQLPPVELLDGAPRRFAIDASGARVEYAGGLTKASGRGASITGTIVRGPDERLRLEDVALKTLHFRGERSANDAS